MRIEGKHILLGVSGGIAAFKSASLVSALAKAGAEVRVCMTKNACRFITPLTLETLSKNRVVTDMFSREAPYEVSHISMAEWADIAVVAPATANIIAKAACGMADDFLSTTLLAVRCPLLFAPAMNSAMLAHPATQANIEALKGRGARFIMGEEGLLACGETGSGRMAEPEDIAACIDGILAGEGRLKGANVLITAGATRERIDDVRFITNRSSGKMGFALAAAALAEGARVSVVCGAAAEEPPKGAQLVRVESAEEMYAAAMERFSDADIVIAAAAVADYTPKAAIAGKMKKGDDFALELVRTKDILAAMGKKKRGGQILIGFAAETENLVGYARQKLEKKNLDMIVANDVSRSDIGFGADHNCAELIKRDGSQRSLPFARKSEIAKEIIAEAAAMREDSRSIQ